MHRSTLNIPAYKQMHRSTLNIPAYKQVHVHLCMLAHLPCSGYR